MITSDSMKSRRFWEGQRNFRDSRKSSANDHFRYSSRSSANDSSRDSGRASAISEILGRPTRMVTFEILGGPARMTTSKILGSGSERWSSNPGQSPRTITFQTRQGLVFALKNPSITPGSCSILKDRISLINYSSNRE